MFQWKFQKRLLIEVSLLLALYALLLVELSRFLLI